MIVAIVLPGISGCGWKVVPPPAPAESAAVFVADYGRHSRIALQVDDQHLREYSYGDWRYYANDERSPWRAFTALVKPGPGGLGRRTLPLTENESVFAGLADSNRAVRLDIEAESVRGLLAKLDDLWVDNLPTYTFSDLTGMHFVRLDGPYHLFRNSNHATGNWLETLGCEVRGVRILSNFRVVEKENER